ncbi:hypothetical protein PF006_g18274 [Phytophthora fragariae]|uniref:Uncharacterized protein n=1 Tax=Phytophthora fragariae TaxID=53985 RepID=A0A6A3SMG6_9STRA|nr:hypothetical protein PF003_g20235 [Phytophthora fragariae]KAE9119835.1 hypothetical protein PF006_g18274 [Phytophthora fragariae]
MNDNELLNAVFRFKHQAPSDRQDEALCVSLAKRFAAFVADLEVMEAAELRCGRVEPLADDRVVPASSFAGHEIEMLRRVAQRLTASGGRSSARGDVWVDPWLPEYGCVLQRTKLNATVVKMVSSKLDRIRN